MMKSFVVLIAVTFGSLMLSSNARAGDDLPPVFDKRPYAEAKKSAAETKKWFIVKATAVWCGPCKQMDKTTWRDETVVKWLEKNAIIVALDVDKEPTLAKELSIQAMPTMIAFADGNKEFDRVVGFKSAGVMLAWLEGIAKGEKSIEAVAKRAAAKDGEKVDIRAKMDLARALTDEGKSEEAADEFIWLWKNMLTHQQSMYGVRLSFMAGDMERLAKQSKVAREKFTALRDETGKRLEGEKVDGEDVNDWVVLNNRVLGDSDATLKWFDRVKDLPKWQPFIDRQERDLADLLIERGRWADVGRLASDPLNTLENEWDLLKLTSGPRQLPAGLPAAQRKQLEEMPKQMFREKVGRSYAGLLAAGRDALATKVAAKAREYDPSADMVKALIETALKADQPRPAHAEWIKATKDETLDDLAKRVTDALERKTPAK